MIRREEDVNTVVARPRFIGQVRSKDVHLVKGHDLAPGVARVAPAGQAVARECWFLPCIFLKGQVTVQAVIATYIELQVCCALINIYRRRNRAVEGRVAAGVDAIRMLNQRQELLNHGISDGGTLHVSRHVGGEGNALVLPQTFVAQEEESFVLENKWNRATQRSAKIVTDKLVLTGSLPIEVIARVKVVIP